MTAQLAHDILSASVNQEALSSMPKPLDHYRRQRFMSQREFAEFLGITQATYVRLIKGYHHAYPATMRKIAEHLGVTPADITEFASFAPPEDDEEAQS